MGKLIKISLSFTFNGHGACLTLVFVMSVTLTLSENFGSIQNALTLSWCFSILYLCVGGQKSTEGGSPSIENRAAKVCNWN